MKKKLDVFFIYSIYIFELIYTFSSMFFNNYTSRHSISTNELGQPIYGKIGIFENVFKISYCMVFIVGVLYILFLIYKIKNHEIIDLKKNTYLLSGIIFMDLVLYGFMLMPMLVSSPAMKVVIICFIVHLLIYMKYKQIFVLK